MNEELLWEYASQMSKPEPDLLKKINRETHLYVMHPRMLSGHVTGGFLRMISCMTRPSRILEIGMYTGYSAICLAEGLTEEGELITIEHDPELEEIAHKYFVEAGLEKKIHILIGEAISVIPKLKGYFDLVFIDADKRDYPLFYEAVMAKTKPGGHIIADNVLWGGKVIDKTHEPDKDTQGIKSFNERVRNDERVENVLLPFRDGIMVIRKK
jgi:predicted O-methyltransferase YrrM